MKLHLEFFGPISDRMQGGGFSVEIDSAPTDRKSLIALIARDHEGAEALDDPHIQIAVNDALVKPGGPLDLSDGDRVAFLSPFSGG